MAEMEMSSDRGRKRQLVDEEVYNSEESDYDDSTIEDYSDSDSDSEFELADGTKVDPEVWKQYYKEWDESEGFDISIYPGASFNHSIVPLRNYLSIPKKKQKYSELCDIAIGKFNSDNAKNYVLVDVVNVNASFASGMFYYFTFEAKNTDTNDANAIETFQALVWNGVNGIIDVEFCRPKKNQGSEVSPHSSVDEGSPHSSVNEGSPRSSVDEGSPRSSVDEVMRKLRSEPKADV